MPPAPLSCHFIAYYLSLLRQGWPEGFRVGPLREHVENWRQALPTEEVERLRRHARTGRPLGETAFLDRTERMLHRVVRPAQRGPKPEEK